MNPLLTPLLIGRRDELKELDAALAAAQNGAGRCVLVGGDAGIGKSRLIAELHDRARERGFTVLTGRCFEQDRVFPYAPFIDMLRPLSDRAAGAGSLAPLPPELLKLLELEDYDLVITDIVMPYVSGVGVITALKAKRPHIPVIAITGYGKEPEEAALEKQADAVLAKPVKMSVLKDLLVKLLDLES